MTLHPEVQRRAQLELEEVIGKERLPKIEDRTSLPYVSAVIKECLRWQTVVPLSVPHKTIVDDVYKDQYFIPKGSIVISNLWYVVDTFEWMY